MKLLIDIGHPANVHYFKHIAWRLISEGHLVYFTTHDKEFEIYLLRKFGFNFKVLGKHRKTKIGKAFGLVIRTIKLILYSIKVKPDIYLSAGSIQAAWVSFIFRRPHITLEDTGNLDQIKYFLPFTDIIITPKVMNKNFGKKQIRIDSYLEYFYLHSKYFSPNKNVLQYLGVDENEKFAILRFVSWEATHDRNQYGLSISEKEQLVSFLLKKYKVFISSEKELPPFLEKYKLSIPPEMIHDAMYYASLYIGEGATMASEASLLGTPSIYVNTIPVCYVQDQEKFGVAFHLLGLDNIIKKMEEINHIANVKGEWMKRLELLKKNKIDPVEFTYDLIISKLK